MPGCGVHTEASVSSSDEPADPRVRRTKADVSRAASELLLEHGWDRVTHAHVAERAGYSRATIYKHWPKQHDLLRAAFGHMGSMPHGERTGDLRDDLISEMEAFRRVLVDGQFSRATAALAERATASADVAAVRDTFLGGGQQLLRDRLTDALTAGDIEVADARVAADMLSGALVWRVVMLGESVPPSYVVVLVDTALAGLRPR